MVKAGYLKVETAHDGLVCVLAVAGELDLVTVADLAESAAMALKTPAERFVLDLSRLSFTDCAGGRALAAITRTVPAGCPVIVRPVSPAVRRVLDLMGVNLESRGMVRGNQAARLMLESQRVRSLAQHALAESRTLAQTLAATEDRVADTLTRLADRRPHRAARLGALSHTARTQAAQLRARARDRNAATDTEPSAPRRAGGWPGQLGAVRSLSPASCSSSDTARSSPSAGPNRSRARR